MKRKLFKIFNVLILVVVIIVATDRWWPVNMLPVGGVDLIVPISYGTHRTHLTLASRCTGETAITLSKKYPEAKVAYGVFTYSFDYKIEENLRKLQLPNGVFAGKISSTIEEAEAIKDKVGFSPKNIVLVAGGYHSRTVKLVWEKYFPESKITVMSIGWQNEIETNQPIVFMCNRWSWLLSNVARHSFLKLPFGFELFKYLKIRQPTLVYKKPLNQARFFI